MTKTANKTKTLTDLEACDCRWPIGDPRQADFHFCGERKLLDRPYCAKHWPLAFDATKQRHKQAAPVLPTPPALRAA